MLDEILTNKPCSFQKTIVCETGPCDQNLLPATVLRSTFVKLPAKFIRHRSYKHFPENIFCHELNKVLIQGELYRSKDRPQKIHTENLPKYSRFFLTNMLP